MSRNVLSRQRRVIRSGDFSLILRRGGTAADGTLVVFALPQDEARASRLGVTIPKRAGNAVTRNRWKRLIRESFRTQSDEIPAGFDFIIRPKKGAGPQWAAVQKSVPRLARRAAARSVSRS